ncbi:hypothetical protein HDV05_005383 [Chytridiales sp. JEL 0842]|nr:hypothetical protein HDV05_005383 [Chytridiales sp. JEL 0842]
MGNDKNENPIIGRLQSIWKTLQYTKVPMWTFVAPAAALLLLIVTSAFRSTNSDSYSAAFPLVGGRDSSNLWGTSPSIVVKENDTSPNEVCAWGLDPESEGCRILSRKWLRTFAQRWQDETKLKPTCSVKPLVSSSGYNVYKICGFTPNKEAVNCNFLSFGIGNDYSFDRTLATDYNCRGVALDPATSHPSYLVEDGAKVKALPFGADLLYTADKPNSWITTSIPAMTKFVKFAKVNILKMNCAGCEYSLARDVSHQDPSFFSRVDQAIIVINPTKAHLRTPRHAHYLGLLLAQLDYAGLKLQAVEGSDCGKTEEVECLKELVEEQHSFKTQRSNMPVRPPPATIPLGNLAAFTKRPTPAPATFYLKAFTVGFLFGSSLEYLLLRSGYYGILMRSEGKSLRKLKEEEEMLERYITTATASDGTTMTK